MTCEPCLANDNRGVIYICKTEWHVRNALNPDAKSWLPHGRNNTQSATTRRSKTLGIPKEDGESPEVKVQFIITLPSVYFRKQNVSNHAARKSNSISQATLFEPIETIELNQRAMILHLISIILLFAQKIRMDNVTLAENEWIHVLDILKTDDQHESENDCAYRLEDIKLREPFSVAYLSTSVECKRCPCVVMTGSKIREVRHCIGCDRCNKMCIKKEETSVLGRRERLTFRIISVVFVNPSAFA
ncbi:hypothetical protein ACOME3_007404 [Neoechinorhynchus agilis]